MQQFTINQIKDKIIPILKEAGIKRSSLFGSYARGEQKDSSDIDLLVEYPLSIDLFTIGELKENLQDVLGRQVDIVGYTSIKPGLKKYILSEQIPIL